MRVQLNNSLIRQAISKAFKNMPETGKLHIVGVRGCVPVATDMLEYRENKVDRYNDSIILFGTNLTPYRASVDPGLYYTENPLHPDGCAHLLNGGPYEFKLGIHKGKPALVQASPFPYWRDKNKNGIRDLSKQESQVHRGVIGLDLHAGGSSDAVGPNSAACQIIWGGWEGTPWKNFYSTCKLSGQDVFKYWLMDFSTLAG